MTKLNKIKCVRVGFMLGFMVLVRLSLKGVSQTKVWSHGRALL